MFNFFGKQTETGDELADSKARLQTVEWKINVLIALVAVHLLLELLSFASAMFLPSKGTIFIVLLVLAIVGWFLRDRILVLVRRTIAQKILGEEQVESSSGSNGHREGSIR